MAIFNAVYTCSTASYKAVSGLIEMLRFDKGENLFSSSSKWQRLKRLCTRIEKALSMESGNFEWLKESEKVVLASRVQLLVSSINLKLDISNRCLADPNKQSDDFISKIHDLQLYNKRTGDDGKSERCGLPPSLSPSPPLSDAKRPLRRREERRIINKCPEKASISVSLLFIDINLLFISSCHTRTSFTDPSAKYELTDGGGSYGIFFF